MRIRTREDNFWAKIAQDPAADQSMEPLTAEEYMMNEAAEKLASAATIPPLSAAAAGKSVVVKEDGSGLEFGEGGSSLPPYTSADIDKVLGLAEDAEHLVEKTVVPEQTGTTASMGVPGFYGFVLEDADTSFFENAQEGDECVLGVKPGDVWYNRTMVFTTDPDTGLSMFAHGSGDSLVVLGLLNGNVVFAGTSDNFTIKIRATASVPSVSPAWVRGGGGNLSLVNFADCTYSFECENELEGGTITFDPDTDVLYASYNSTMMPLGKPVTGLPTGNIVKADAISGALMLVPSGPATCEAATSDPELDGAFYLPNITAFEIYTPEIGTNYVKLPANTVIKYGGVIAK